jgi:hypothetical protein
MGRTSSPQKTTAPRLSSQRFSIVPKPTATGLDRPLNKNTAINEHYRSLLVAQTTAKSVLVASPGNAPTTTAEARQGASQESQGENLLYSGEKLWVSNAYPNPADEFAELDYQFNGPVSEAKLVLLSVLGTPVSSHDLDRNERKVRIATRAMDSGYYLYQLSVDGKKVATKRLLVRHQ